MNFDERLDKLELDLKALDKKIWLLVVVVIVFFIKGSEGALTGILTGAAIASGVSSTMDPTTILGIAAAAGSAFRAYLGFSGYKNSGAKWDWGKFIISVLPAVVGAFAVGITFEMDANLQNSILVFMGAAGLNSLQDKFGLQKKSK